MKQTPPIGVIAPSILILVIANAYKLNENNNIPDANKYPEALKFNSVKNFDNNPLIISAAEWKK